MLKSLPTRSRLAVGVLGIACTATLSACADTDPTVRSSQSSPTPQVTHSFAPTEPIDVRPVGERTAQNECPYLDTQWVADTNGQRVTGMDVDNRFSTPACVYWSYPEAPQLEVMVREMPTEEQAIAVVDWAAPIEHTNPADLPGDWMGGRAGGGMIPGREGSVYAVQHGTTAVVVFSNQEQSFKAEQIAVEAMKNLELIARDSEVG